MSFSTSFFLGESFEMEGRQVFKRHFLGCALLQGGCKEAHTPPAFPPASPHQQWAGILQGEDIWARTCIGPSTSSFCYFG